ncbi:MAG TPA: DUF362 domain-containing protein [Tenuifilaceae bacterium]|nr:DUF362 domain-containing protein [Tenuifilaceae bacterium]HPE18248.1 DUF362 domain-containing protein [Tenuifilaceae bacterium]HPJ45223.1 DUF362 domain-containing protein [Tenuifilaceae bacterium]HPQ33345.1 DUF362 domain-containing protein [Tenuifilaceae bacterium]HRX68971.1 DUF362 domain-containing protein [Tenuifilaceae bacterium]
MKRRDFLKKGIGAGVAAGALMRLGAASTNAFGSTADASKPYDLVAVLGGEPSEMFDKAIAAVGGMGKFVKKGQTVVVKPNIGWDTSPERGGDTNPHLVGRIIEHCFQAGAKDVFVFDNTCDEWGRCYKNSGIEDAVKSAGGKVVPGNTENYYKPVSVPKGKKLTEAKVHELILNSDVFINVPVLKHHSSAKLTIAMKNLMGIVWDRRYWHRNDLHQCIADFATWRKPDLNIIDAYRVMTRNGPRGVSEADIVIKKSLILSTDMVAADAAAAKIFGSEPSSIPYIKIAHEMGVGNMNLEELNIERIKVS